ncbi:inhibitor of KinA sporulation pathway (predicted exonuclease) [Chryseobacterium defluvii]|uniref:Inhibitor of KinA sporulation pathway (Predicted exonuclease) n=1 Tax=Chryseobacterium defluvii TaxID=160396 RepID=A0A840KK80_9FLAO|nr:3'-5' exonuclease [Chryseobacterium defluvii]MBB4807923.1 inhibitor of KinA sporulation pathway (predicted exonuclease) [Chryseobacterium defluvii]
MKTTENILIIDLEATCWQDRPPIGQESEIIEIGICIMDAKTGRISKNEGILIKPQYSTVSPFCTELTSITREMLDDEGILLEDAFDILREEYHSEDLIWASYGNYDLNMLQRQSQKFRVDYPLGDDHINVKTLFAELHPIRKSVGMDRALKELKIPLEGTHHRGVDDVKNIAKILHWCLQNS